MSVNARGQILAKASLASINSSQYERVGGYYATFSAIEVEAEYGATRRPAHWGQPTSPVP